MRAVTAPEPGGPDALVVSEHPDPTAGPGEVVIDVVASAVNARGTDLRPGRNTDLVSLVQSESRRNTTLAAQVTRLRSEVDTLAAAQSDTGGADLTAELADYLSRTGPHVP